MKNVYIGKKSISGSGLAICKVLDSDISTGNVIAYNRETGKVETILFEEKRTLSTNILKLAEDTEENF